ncbi:putative Brp/Blh family beta-carotene 15,15'-monooxygenase [metagenome]|uniref:Putative Brp/Blh family beta-carotene 15,15'-monooxygenase n=1 Tax=metagenome TaxID=256318 RepID=A0A2P2CBY1_9ZZZZ
MGKPNFLFAGLAAGLLAMATALVAFAYDLPIRDPDGAGMPTYVRLPAILLLAVLVDVVPRAIGRFWPSPAQMLRGCVSVTRERWGARHLIFAFSGLGVWYLAYVAFRNLKSYVPMVNDTLWDTTLARYDRVLWLGNDPATVLHRLFGTGWAAEFFSLVYIAWIVLVPVTLAVALMWTRHVSAGAWYVTAVTLDWVLGVAVYFAVPTVGPIYSDPEQFSGLRHTAVSGLQESMMNDRLEVLADPHHAHSVQTIAAFASLHVGIMVTICLVVHLIGLPRWVRLASWAFLALTVLATVYLGWHFFVDTIAGAALGAATVWMAAIATGNHERGWPKLVVRADDRPVSVGQSNQDRSTLRTPPSSSR